MTTEPTIGLIRLAWWREALERLDHAPPPAEPLLVALAAQCLPSGVTGALLASIEDGWAALLDGDDDSAAIARHGRERGANLFAAAAILLDRHNGHVPGSTPNVRVAGNGWALADLGHRYSSPEIRTQARAQASAAFEIMPEIRWPRPLRPLGALAVLAKRDAHAHARAQGSPGRLLRMLALRVTGL